MNHLWRLMMVGVLLVFIQGARAEDTRLPSVTAAKFAAAPVMDGKLDDACWKDAPCIHLERELLKTNAPAAATEVQLGCDDRWLYLGFRCQNLPGTPVQAKARGRHSMTISLDDAIEIFIGGQSDREYPYRHFKLSAGNAQQDQVIVGATYDDRRPGWIVGWRSATAVQEGEWTAEVALPLYVLGLHQASDRLPFNVTRAVQGQPPVFCCWAPVGGKDGGRGFHDPAHFGRLAGLSVTETNAYDPVLMRTADFRPFTKKADEYQYSFDVLARNAGNVAGDDWLVIRDRAADGACTTQEVAIHLPPAGESRIPVAVSVAYPADRTAEVTLKSRIDWGNAWMPVAGTEMLVTLMAYPSLSYFSGETNALLVVGCAYSDDQFQKLGLRLTIRVDNPAGKAVLEQTYDRISQQGVLQPLPVAKLSRGIYPARVELRNREGHSLAVAQAAIRVEDPPPPGIIVTKIDHRQICLLKNGQPFFPYGFWVNDVGLGSTSTPSRIEILKQAGNDLCDWMTPAQQLGWGNRTDKPIWTEKEEAMFQKFVAKKTEVFAFLDKNGLPYVAECLALITIAHSGPELNRDHPLVMKKLPEVIERFKRSPGLLTWFGTDEVHPGVLKEVREHSALIRALDPYHVIYASATGASPEMYQAYDVYGFHHYYSPEEGPNRLAWLINSGWQTAKMARRPAFATPQGQRLTYARELTPDERRAGIYLSIINGAKGIQFFYYQPNINPTTWRVFRYTFLELEILAPLLLAERPPQNIACRVVDRETPAECPALPEPRTLYDPSAPGQYSSGGVVPLPLVQASLHDLEGGELILICNSGHDPVTVNCALSSLNAASNASHPPAALEVQLLRVGSDAAIAKTSSVATALCATSVKDYFTDQDYPVKAGRFAMTLEPYGVRILKTAGSTRPAGAPVSLGITALPSRSKPDPEGPAPRRYQMTEAEKKDALKAVGFSGASTGLTAFVFSAADDLSAVVMEPPPRPGENIFKNSSFEVCSLADMADCWNEVNGFQNLFLAVEDPTAVDGKISLLLTSPALVGRPNVCYKFWTNWEYGKTYTFSAYVRADKPGSRLAVTGHSGSCNDLPDPRQAEIDKAEWGVCGVDVKWQRVMWTFTPPSQGPHRWTGPIRIMLFNFGPGYTTRIWVDAVQLELGEQATEYKRDSYQGPKIDPKWLSDDVFKELEKR